jgi:hypothetical protein
MGRARLSRPLHLLAETRHHNSGFRASAVRSVAGFTRPTTRRGAECAPVVPNVRRQRGAAPASCARLQPRQLPAHAGDAGADQGLVTDK